MTPSERQYSKYVGKLFYSRNRNSLVLVTGLNKTSYSNRWQYDVEYMDPNYGSKNIKCKRLDELLRMGQWIPAAQYIKMQPPSSSKK